MLNLSKTSALIAIVTMVLHGMAGCTIKQEPSPVGPTLLHAETADVKATIDKVAELLPPALGLRTAMRAIVGGAASAFREEAEKFMETTVNPMIDRVNIIIRRNIRYAADEAIRVVNHATNAMNQIIDNAALRARDQISQFFARLDRTLEKSLARVDELLTIKICQLAPEGKGLLINVPFVAAHDEVRVWQPHLSRCWSGFLTSDEKPFSKVFDGWQAYKGQICEEDFSIHEIHPDDPRSIERVAEKYARLVALVSQAQCSAKPDVDRTFLMLRRITYEKKALFYRRLAGFSKAGS